MKILVVSFIFPPYMNPAACRASLSTQMRFSGRAVLEFIFKHVWSLEVTKLDQAQAG